MNGENTGRVIVALPHPDDPIHSHGNEDKHMTVVWLGKPEENPGLDMDQVRGQVEGVAQRYGPQTGTIESTGKLGDEGALVAFLRGDGLQEVHDDLLAQPHIRDGFDAVKQHPSWTPHVTVGYPGGEGADGTDPTDLPTQDEIGFDRLAVWDGDNRAEYPLAGGEDLAQQMYAEMAKPIVVINDAATLAAAVLQVSGYCGTAAQMTKRILMKRARELGCQHVIPLDWTRKPEMSETNKRTSMAAVAAGNVSDVSPFVLKCELAGLPTTALHAAYMRGVREYTMTAPCSRPPLTRDQVAQARVNSLIRLAQGDPSARLDDQDLLP